MSFAIWTSSTPEDSSPHNDKVLFEIILRKLDNLIRNIEDSREQFFCGYSFVANLWESKFAEQRTDKSRKKVFKSVLDNYTEGEFLQIELEEEQMLVFLIESNFIRYLVSLNFLLNKTFQIRRHFSVFPWNRRNWRKKVKIGIRKSRIFNWRSSPGNKSSSVFPPFLSNGKIMKSISIWSNLKKEKCLINSANTPFSFIKEWRKAMKRRSLCLHHQTFSVFYFPHSLRERWLQMLQFSFCEISIIRFPR